MIGISEGNGHPYSFSAIINGYDDVGMQESGWENIYKYLKERDISDFGILDAQVTHVWTQNLDESCKIAKASKIAHVVENYSDMVNEVDAVIIGRDDYESHRKLSEPFLKAGKFVFIDKPLSLATEDLEFFYPFIQNGQLASYSGFRYAPELDALRRDLDQFGTIKLVKGTIIKSWEKYGIHLLDAIFSVIPFDVLSIRHNPSNHESFTLFQKDGSLIELNALGTAELVLRVEFFSDSRYYKADMLNAFDSFRRSLWHFVASMKPNYPQKKDLTISLMKVLIAGEKSKALGRTVSLDEIIVNG